MLRSDRFADLLVIGPQALHQLVIDHFIVDAVTNRSFSLRVTILLIFHRSIISRGWELQPFRPAAGAVVHARDLDR